LQLLENTCSIFLSTLAKNRNQTAGKKLLFLLAHPYSPNCSVTLKTNRQFEQMHLLAS